MSDGESIPLALEHRGKIQTGILSLPPCFYLHVCYVCSPHTHERKEDLSDWRNKTARAPPTQTTSGVCCLELRSETIRGPSSSCETCDHSPGSWSPVAVENQSARLPRLQTAVIKARAVDPPSCGGLLVIWIFQIKQSQFCQYD